MSTSDELKCPNCLELYPANVSEGEDTEKINEATHDQLKNAVHRFDLDFGWTHKTSKPDCSCGCKWYHALEGDRSGDWGVCFNILSPRCGLLTFEHMGCNGFEPRE
jgi:hypothetical protein